MFAPEKRVLFNPDVLWSPSRVRRAIRITARTEINVRRRLNINPVLLSHRQTQHDPKLAYTISDVHRIAIDIYGDRAGRDLCRLHGIPVPTPVRAYCATDVDTRWIAVPC